jgi:hypothetical protein
MSDNSCSCAGEVAALRAEVNRIWNEINRINSEMGEIARAIDGMGRQLGQELRAVQEAVQTSNKELALIAGTTAATVKSVQRTRESLELNFQRQTSAIVQLDSVKNFAEALAMGKKVAAFASEVDERFGKAVEGVALNRMLYDQHFSAIRKDYESKLRTIGSHIYQAWEQDIQPVERAAQIPMTSQQELAREVDLHRLASRSALLDSDLDFIWRERLEPLVSLDSVFERSLDKDYAIDGSPREGLQAAVPATVAFSDDGVLVFIDCEVGADGIVQRGTLPEHAAFCATAEGQRRIKASAKVRAMTDGEVAQLTAAIDRLAERGLVDPELVPGYQKYLEATRLGIVEGTVQTPGGPDA